jgi:TolB protein
LLTEPGDYADPTWSPNDELIAYRYETHIWVMDSNGHNRRPLTDGTLDQDPSWSPDGHRLAFKHQSASGTNDVWVINLDGTNARDITDSPDLDESAPAWSRR